MASLTLKKKRLVLDIGSSAIRLCELAQTKSGYQLVKYYQKNYSSDPGLEEDESRAARNQAMADLLKEAKARAKKAIFGVPGQSVFTRSRTLPPVPEFKVTQIVRYEIQQQIPFSLDQIAMDYQILDRTAAGGYDVMMAAIKVDVVDKHLSALQSVKRSVDVVDVCPLAAYNWLKHTGEFGDQGECVALIDIGAVTTDIVIEREGKFRFTRPLNIGGNDITLAVGSAFGMNFSDAERLKCERGFAPTGDPKTDGKGGEVVGQALQRLVSEVMRSFAYFRSLPGGGQVNRVILCGGGACLRNLVPFMQRQLSMDVRIAQPLAGLAIAPGAQQVSDHPEQACVALGLALRCCDTVPLEVNLIPPRILEAAQRKEQIFYWVLSLVTLALIFLSMVPVKANENKLVRTGIDTVKSFICMYDAEQCQRIANETGAPPSAVKAEYTRAKTAVESLSGNVWWLDKHRSDRRFWIEELALVSGARPPSGRMWFSAIESTSLSPLAAAGGVAGALNYLGVPIAPVAPTPSYSYDEGYDDEDDGGFGYGGGGGGGGAAVITGLPADVISTGFMGIEGLVGATMTPGMGGFGTPSFGAPGTEATIVRPPAPIPTMPNSLVLTGFAESDRQINEFVSALKQMQRIMPNKKYLSVEKVHFSDTSVHKVNQQILRDAPPAGSSNLGQFLVTGTVDPRYDNSVYSFTIGVQLRITDGPPQNADPNDPNAAPGMANPNLSFNLSPPLNATANPNLPENNA